VAVAIPTVAAPTTSSRFCDTRRAAGATSGLARIAVTLKTATATPTCAGEPLSGPVT
jgi:hypothetical protein